MNGQFASEIGSPIEVAWLGFTVSLVVIAAVVLIWQRDQLRALAAALRDHFPRWQLLGGLFGASLVAAQAASVPVLGVALFSVLVVGGQTLSSLAVDRSGLVPGGRRYLSAARVAGAVLMVGGAVTAAVGRSSVSSFAPAWLIIVVLAGAALPLQQAFNARVAQTSGSALVAALVNFVAGAAALSAVMLARQVAGVGIVGLPAPWTHPQFWVPGLLGVFGIVIAALVVPWLGVLVFGLVSIAGLLVSSLLLDVVSGPVPVTAMLVAGVGVCVIAAFVGSARPADSDPEPD